LFRSTEAKISVMRRRPAAAVPVSMTAMDSACGQALARDLGGVALRIAFGERLQRVARGGGVAEGLLAVGQAEHGVGRDVVAGPLVDHGLEVAVRAGDVL